MIRKGILLAGITLLTALVLIGCRSKTGDSDLSQQPSPAPTKNVQTAENDEEQVYRYSQLLVRDSIRPVYEPEFVPAAQAELDDDDLVLAIEIDGQAKAYPIRVLNSREMVNDELAGVPILATW